MNLWYADFSLLPGLDTIIKTVFGLYLTSWGMIAENKNKKSMQQQ